MPLSEFKSDKSMKFLKSKEGMGKGMTIGSIILAVVGIVIAVNMIPVALTSITWNEQDISLTLHDKSKSRQLLRCRTSDNRYSTYRTTAGRIVHRSCSSWNIYLQEVNI